MDGGRWLQLRVVKYNHTITKELYLSYVQFFSNLFLLPPFPLLYFLHLTSYILQERHYDSLDIKQFDII